MQQKAIIIGAGPAGLTAAYELLQRTGVMPVILEKSDFIGGISRTINFKGNRMDMGPHRFFSKSERVMNWWLSIFPLEHTPEQPLTISYQNKSRNLQPAPAVNRVPGSVAGDKVMIVVPRLTRIYFLRRFFYYPLQLSLDTLKKLGFGRTVRIMASYVKARLLPRKQVNTLEDFIVNKFGVQLYNLFFKDYTEKVWGVPCHQISAEWGAQRIKGVSLSKAIRHAIQSIGKAKELSSGLAGQDTETSLIEQFLYPKKGPGQLWEEVARQVESKGGQLFLNEDVVRIAGTPPRIQSVTTRNSRTGVETIWEGDFFFSTMPVQELIGGMNGQVPSTVKEVAAGLQYRDFINVGVLLKQLSSKDENNALRKKVELKDSWIYVQERDVKVGRLMIYNNWGSGMVHDPNTTWIGLEYFCNKTDAFWTFSDEEVKELALRELEKMDLAQRSDVLDMTVARMEKTYPAYFGTYNRFDEIRAYADQFENLFLVGRNGMHKYNNADHSMLTAMVAVDNIAAGISTKQNIWSINTEQEYHEEKSK